MSPEEPCQDQPEALAKPSDLSPLREAQAPLGDNGSPVSNDNRQCASHIACDATVDRSRRLHHPSLGDAREIVIAPDGNAAVAFPFRAERF